jgi:Tfp pilus assembly protein FimT
MKQKTIHRAFLLLTLVLSCALQSRAETTETISSTTADWGYENGAVVSGATIGDFTLTFSKGTGNNAPAYYTSDNTLRFYDGNTVTVTSSNSDYTPTRFGDYELTNGSFTFTFTKKLKTVTITYTVTPGGDVVSKTLIGDIYYDIDGSVATAVGCSSSATTLNIPSKITYNSHTYPVTSIGNYSFFKCTGLTSVTIGNSVTSIDGYAFYGCTGLTSVIIGNSVTSIGDLAFEGCTGLVKGAYPNSISDPFSNGETICYIADNALIEDGIIWNLTKSEIGFVPCDYQGGFTIPNSVTVIDSYAFYGCSDCA